MDLLYSTVNSTQPSVRTYMGKKSSICITDSLCYTPKTTQHCYIPETNTTTL